jgi:hypothetical protein
LVDNAWNDPAGTTHGEGIWVHEVGHQMQATGVTTAERLRIADWSKLGDWKHGTGKVADGTHPYKRTDNAIYKDPTVGGNTRESVSGYGKTDPAEDWAEFGRPADLAAEVPLLRHPDGSGLGQPPEGLGHRGRCGPAGRPPGSGPPPGRRSSDPEPHRPAPDRPAGLIRPSYTKARLIAGGPSAFLSRTGRPGA